MPDLILPRRRFLAGLAAALAAPAIVRAGSLMPVKAIEPKIRWVSFGTVPTMEDWHNIGRLGIDEINRILYGDGTPWVGGLLNKDPRHF